MKYRFTLHIGFDDKFNIVKCFYKNIERQNVHVFVLKNSIWKQTMYQYEKISNNKETMHLLNS